MSLEKPAYETKVGEQPTRDQCIEIRALRRFGLTIQNLTNELGFTTNQVQPACARKMCRIDKGKWMVHKVLG